MSNIDYGTIILHDSQAVATMNRALPGEASLRSGCTLKTLYRGHSAKDVASTVHEACCAAELVPRFLRWLKGSFYLDCEATASIILPNQVQANHDLRFNAQDRISPKIEFLFKRRTFRASSFVVTCVWSCSESRWLGHGHGHAGSQRITGPLYLLVVADVVMQLCSA